MNPGRELDALVAEKVFGHTVVDYNQIGRADKHSKNDDGSLTLVPQYSKHIAAAWMVVEKFGQYQINDLNGKHYAVFENKGHSLFEAEADTAPHAICLAALKAVGVNLE